MKRTRTVADSPSAGSVHLLRADDPAVVLDVERHGLAGVAGLRQHDVDDQRRALEHRARRLDAVTWMSRGERLLADADGEHRKLAAFEAEQRVVERGVGGVGAVASPSPARRAAGPASSSRARSSAGPSRVGVPSNFRSLPARRDPRRGREAEEADDEALRQRLEQRAVGAAELLLDEVAARLAVQIGDLHAARVVDQHAEEVLLRDRGVHDQRRPEQAEEDERERGEAQADEDDAIAQPAIGHAHARGR